MEKGCCQHQGVRILHPVCLTPGALHLYLPAWHPTQLRSEDACPSVLCRPGGQAGRDMRMGLYRGCMAVPRSLWQYHAPDETIKQFKSARRALA
jgi:hypothetical protein